MSLLPTSTEAAFPAGTVLFALIRTRYVPGLTNVASSLASVHVSPLSDEYSIDEVVPFILPSLVSESFAFSVVKPVGASGRAVRPSSSQSLAFVLFVAAFLI